MSASQPPLPQQSAALIAAANHRLALGRLGEAEEIYREILARDSHAPDALLGLAGIALAVRRHDAARLLVQRAAGDMRRENQLWNDLGSRRFFAGDFGAARHAFARAIALCPDDADYLYHLGIAWRDAGDGAAALKYFARAATARPMHPFAGSDLGVQWQVSGDLEKAGTALRRFLCFDPARAAGWHNYGLLMAAHGRSAAEATAYARAIAIDQTLVQTRYNAGCLALGERRYGLAVKHQRMTLALDPGHAQAWNNLGCALREQGFLEEAVLAFRRGYAAAPDNTDLPSNIAMSLTVVDGPESDRFVRAWGERFSPPARPAAHRPRARLRVGYLSPDMRHHSCAYFLEPLFAAHDRTAIEVFAYADVPAPDATTARLRALSDTWRNIGGQDDATVCGQIAADQLDILVDLAGHTSRNRLRIFAARPAPVQMSWLGYNATTGLRQIDWKLVDRWTLPEDGAEWFAERLWPLDRLAHCWRPPANAPEIRPSDTPAGHVVLGSFNALHKLSNATLALWVRILQRLPRATLRLKGGAGADPATRARIIEGFARAGTADRVVIEDWATDTASHLALYRGIDIALDPFPYNGTTTTCEALWMGVPVVTKTGDRMLSRIGTSLLSAAGLTELVAESDERYIETAAMLATSRNRLTQLRETLRQRLENSVLRDETGFARSIEAAYRQMVDLSRA